MSGTLSRMGRCEGLKMRTSQPSRCRMREASKAINLEYDLYPFQSDIVEVKKEEGK